MDSQKISTGSSESDCTTVPALSVGASVAVQHTPGPRAKFYVARRDTRWDVYPQLEPQQVVAHDWRGFYQISAEGKWFLTPTSFNLEREISATEAGYPTAVRA